MMKKIIGRITLVCIIVIVGYSTVRVIVKPDVNQPTQALAQQAAVTTGQKVGETYFTRADQHPDKALIDIINASTQTLDIAIYSLTHPDIVAAIKGAKDRGVTARLITDKVQSDGKVQAEAMKVLGSASIPMKVNKHNGLMHMKVTIADKKVVTTGSFNYSKAASTSNDEVLMVIREPEIAKSFTEQFEQMWNDTKGFETIERKIAQ
ncbi:phospholipase D-like domain-containing protein [Paenibacillus periandrae]|uniref:phospholipase D-like domain-containing protein n=1 Tax=Paenibacillus periandrae TaxID=1761741 RepID=UPI001F090BBD|nr:phospholipase D-like domain-containing protein [Paenibacillus periandrae]